MDYFVHEQAICESGMIGSRTRIWAFAHILPRAVLGQDCNICDGVFIENDVIVGDRVTIKCGVQLWDGMRLMDDVFIGSNATFTNDKHPRSKQYPETFHQTVIEAGATIGANATLLPGLRIGMGAMVGAGAVVTKDVPPKAVVVGNPATIVGYSGMNRMTDDALPDTLSATFPLQLGVGGTELWQLNSYEDMRGSLVVADFSVDLPFVPRRSFMVHHVPSRDVRGEHAHRICEQFLVCICGSVSVVVDDGQVSKELCLSSADMGLYIPTLIWAVQYKFSSDARLLVYASQPYNSAEYIRDYETFLSAASKQAGVKP